MGDNINEEYSGILWLNGWCDGNYADNSLAAREEDHYNTGSWLLLEAWWIQMWSWALLKLEMQRIPWSKVWVTVTNASVKLRWRQDQHSGSGLLLLSWSHAHAYDLPRKRHTKKRRESEHRILCAVWVRQGGRVETINQLKDVTLTIWKKWRLDQTRWEWRGTENRPWWEHPSFQLERCLQLVLSGPSDWLAPSSILSLDCIQLYTSFSLKLIKSLLPSGCFSLFLLYFLRSEL